MNSSNRHPILIAALFIKGIDGVMEIIGGITFFLIKPATINSFLILLTEHELSKDPNDFIATHLIQFGQSLSISSQHFGGIFLVSHGITKLLLVIAVVRNHLKAYVVTMFFLVASIIYQLYRVSIGHSFLLAFFTLYDMVVVWLLFREYKRLHELHNKKEIA